MTHAPSVIVATYAEIALKGRNRALFMRKLINNIRTALQDEPLLDIQHVESRLLVHLDGVEAVPRAAARLHDVFGLQWLSPVASVLRPGLDAEIAADLAAGRDPALAQVCALACDLTRRHRGPARNFKVATRRSDRAFPLDSPVVNRIVGAAVQQDSGLPACMRDPEFTVNILVLKPQILVFAAKEPAWGGLPAGSSGRVLTLLSGGIDSPVAAWLMMRRGCRPEFVHFYSGRSVAEADTGKIEGIVKVLAGYFPTPVKLHLLPAAPYEMRAIGTIPDPYDMVMFRRYMFKTSERLARTTGCRALVAGDSLGQVASQTVHNLGAVASDVRLPVLRPLVGMDKLEITAWSQRIGLYALSLAPYRDCCSIRSPRPVLTARAQDLLRLSKDMDLGGAITEAMHGLVTLKIPA